jgi:peroxiredoxin
MHAYRDQYAQTFNGGRNVVLMAVSNDPPETLASWARDDELPFLMASDSGTAVGALYGAANDKRTADRRVVFVVGPDGKIVFRAAPFREIDPTAYTELGEAIRKTLPVDSAQ